MFSSFALMSHFVFELFLGLKIFLTFIFVTHTCLWTNARYNIIGF